MNAEAEDARRQRPVEVDFAASGSGHRGFLGKPPVEARSPLGQIARETLSGQRADGIREPVTGNEQVHVVEAPQARVRFVEVGDGEALQRAAPDAHRRQQIGCGDGQRLQFEHVLHRPPVATLGLGRLRRRRGKLTVGHGPTEEAPHPLAVDGGSIYVANNGLYPATGAGPHGEVVRLSRG